MLILYSGLFAQTQIAVVEFKALGLSKQNATILTDRLMIELFRTKQFKVLEREMLDRIIDEQKFQLSGCNSDECLVELGQIANVEQIVGGSISKLGDVYSISARLISVETGELIRTGIYDYEGKVGKLITIGMTNVAAQLASIPISIQDTQERPDTQTTKQSINSRVVSTPKPKNDKSSKRKPSTSGSAETVTDIDGNVYKTVRIGNQVWMASNLRVTHYPDGTAISKGNKNDVYSNLSVGVYTVYMDETSNADTYGYLYNWYAIKKIAPSGWHVPTDDEWKELEMTLRMSQSEADGTGFRGTNEGSKLAGNTGLWNSGTLENDSEFGTSGFAVLPGGYRSHTNGHYFSMGYGGYFWSATVFDSPNAWYRKLAYANSDIYRSNHNKKDGHSVRLVRD